MGKLEERRPAIKLRKGWEDGVWYCRAYVATIIRRVLD
jgi:hypothetical protein